MMLFGKQTTIAVFTLKFDPLTLSDINCQLVSCYQTVVFQSLGQPSVITNNPCNFYQGSNMITTHMHTVQVCARSHEIMDPQTARCREIHTDPRSLFSFCREILWDHESNIFFPAGSNEIMDPNYPLCRGTHPDHRSNIQIHAHVWLIVKKKNEGEHFS